MSNLNCRTSGWCHKALLGVCGRTSHTLCWKCYECDSSARVKEKHRRKRRFSICLSSTVTIKKKKRQGKVQGGRNANLCILERSNKTIEIIFKDTCMLNESYKIKNIHLKIMVKTLKCCSKSLKIMWHVF